MDASEADESIQRILDSGRIRIGVNTVAGGVPYLYTMNTEDNSTSTNLFLSVEDEDAELTGYEVEGAREAVRRIGNKYDTELAADFVLVVGPPYFDPLEEALNSGVIDVVWSRMGVNEERADTFDFVCPNYFTEYRIASAAEVGTEYPPDNATVPVGCIAIICSFNVPPPFELVDLELSGQEYEQVLLNSTLYGVEYTINTVDRLVPFFTTDCPTCGFVEDAEPVATSSWAPSTAKLRMDDNDGGGNNSSSFAKFPFVWTMLAISGMMFVPTLFSSIVL